MSYPIGSLLSVLAGRVQENLEFVDHFAPEWDPETLLAETILRMPIRNS